jgi:hypothetical protein
MSGIPEYLTGFRLGKIGFLGGTNVSGISKYLTLFRLRHF